MANSVKKSNNNGSAATSKNISNPASNSRSKSQENQTEETVDLMELFEHGLRDILWAEKALTKAIPKMAKNATDEELKEALEEHLTVTEGQIEKLNQIFESIGKAARGKKCSGMEGIITEGEEIMEEFDNDLINAAIITAASKVEHYEMSSYTSLILLANKMGLQDEVSILESILAEEQESDAKLQMIGERLQS